MAQEYSVKRKFTSSHQNEVNNVKNTFPKQEAAPNNNVNPEEIKQLEEEIAKQGSLVRKLKESKADKVTWQPEVDKLLVLKNQLATLTGISIATSQKTRKVK